MGHTHSVDTDFYGPAWLTFRDDDTLGVQVWGCTDCGATQTRALDALGSLDPAEFTHKRGCPHDTFTDGFTRTVESDISDDISTQVTLPMQALPKFTVPTLPTEPLVYDHVTEHALRIIHCEVCGARTPAILAVAVDENGHHNYYDAVCWETRRDDGYAKTPWVLLKDSDDNVTLTRAEALAADMPRCDGSDDDDDEAWDNGLAGEW